MTLKRTISGMIGTGSLAHNRREFIAENVDPDRVQLNICYQNENLKEVYKVSFIEDDIEVFRKLVDYVEVNYSDEKITIQKSLSSYLEITHVNAKNH